MRKERVSIFYARVPAEFGAIEGDRWRATAMTDIYALAALWLGLALAATLLSMWLRIATAMSDVVV